MKLDSRHILILLGLTSALSSCVQFSGQEGMAQLYPPVFEVDATVEDLAQTKAAAPALPTFDAPALSQVHFTVKDKDGKVVYDKTGVWDSPLQLPVGAYSIDAYSGSNTFGSAYFTGTASGTVAGGQEETPSITMVLQNALLAVGLTENLAQHFTVAGENCIRISTASASIDTGKDEYVYVPSGEALSIFICGTSSAGVAKTITHSLAARSAATATYLKCDMTTTNAPAITLSGTAEAWGSVGFIPVATIENVSEANKAKIKYYASSRVNTIEGTPEGGYVKFTGLTPGETYQVRAEIGALKSNDDVIMKSSQSALTIKTAADHTKNAGDELDGTDFTASFSVPEKFGVTGATISLCKTDGTVLRTTTLTGTTADWTSDGSAESAWPYLPEGAYTLKGQVTQDGQTIDLAPQQINAPATDFQIEVTGTTSYDLYTSGNASAANKADPESITGIGYTVKISQALKDNSNYSYSDTFTLDGNDAKNTTSVSGQSWANHPLVAKATFAGKEITVQKDCHITGLPYEAVPPTSNSNDIHKWNKKSGTISWESDKVTLSWATGAYPCIYSPDFHIPNDINVSARTKIVRNKTKLNYNSELGIWVNEKDKAYSANLNNGSTFENTISETMTATYNKWYIQYNYMATGPKTYVYYFNIDYN